MSLDEQQRADTASELAANAALAGLGRDELAKRTGLTADRLEAALRVEGARPADVWVVRDVLETAAREAGASPVPYTVLTEQMRAAAGGWFGVTDRR